LSRLAPLDKALVLIVGLLWFVCFGFGVRAVIHDGPDHPALGLSVENASSYPVVTGAFIISQYSSDPLAKTGLLVGDRLVRVGDADLRGVGTRGFSARTLDEAKGGLDVPLLVERDNERFETTLDLVPRTGRRPFLVASLALAASALFLLLRGRPTPMLRAYFGFAMCWALTIPFHSTGLGFYVWSGLLVAANCVLIPLIFRFLFLFPDEHEPEGRWHRVWPWLFAAQGPFIFFSFSGRMALGVYSYALGLILAMVMILVIATAKYRRADRVARRQMKWVLFGAYCVALTLGTAAGFAFFGNGFGSLWVAAWWVVPILPFCLVISVIRFNLFDIDRLLSATASLNILAVLLVAGALFLVPRAAEAASILVGIDAVTGQAVLSLALAALVIPAHRRLRPQIDRVFFKERYALDHGIAELLPALSTCTNALELTERAGAALHRLLRPEACVVYAAVEQSYTPVFVEGQAVPLAFASASPLVASLVERRAPLFLSDAGRRPDDTSLGPFDRAALETLQAEVVVPVRQDDALTAFLCLGPKRSGDVYTSTDLSLLAAVAEKVSTELHRFDQEETIREAREMQESLRRYVPGAIAEQLSSGSELASGEREVSVLFVDIRGYTGFAESRKAEEVFSTVNRYTETVSQIVQRHAGSVVEFNGDGMMAVFGAPRELAHKERAAVEAGREMVAAVGALPVEGDEPLSVGVGIATGEAFVGNIQAVDRMIWSAIGNTTNLAARLQNLTRDLGASVVIDSATWERAQRAAADFDKRPDVPIRGRREAQDVYSLPSQVVS